MLKRKFERKLEDWKKGNKVLLVDGARQVGKTFLIEHFCKQHFSSFLEINLSTRPDAIEPLQKARTVEEFLFALTSFSSVPLKPKETAIFIDEIQLATQIDFQTLAKPLSLDGRYRFVFSGSLLGVTEFNTALDPTGFMYTETMYPLDFEEFLWANKIQDGAIEKAKECFEKRTPLPSFLHQIFLDQFYHYLVVGGMPEVVNSYVERQDLPTLRIIFKSIEQHYLKDITKYAPKEERPMIRSAYEVLPSEISSKSKRFILKNLGKRSSVSRESNYFVWLSSAGIAIPVYNVDEPKTPLLLSRNSLLLKLFSSDVGMLSYRLMDTGIQQKILGHQKDINFGSVFENVVAQELTAHGYRDLYYFSSKKKGEVDFILEYKGDVLPVEVKSGKDYKRHVALDNLLSNQNYDIKEAFVFSDANIETRGNKTYFPIYLIGCLEKEE